MLPTLTSKYHTPFEQTLCEDSDSTGSETGLVGEKRRTSPKHSKRDANNAYSRKSISFIIVALILGFCSGIAGAGLFIYINADRACLQLQSTYCKCSPSFMKASAELIFSYFSAPVLQDIPARLATVRFNGSLDYPSEYRGAPSLQVDGAWDKMTKGKYLIQYIKHANISYLTISLVKIISVSESDVIKSGSTKDAVRVPEEFGGGYMATLEITHQLHCLVSSLYLLGWHQSFTLFLELPAHGISLGLLSV